MSFLGTLALAPIELLLGRLIAHDPHTREQFARFDGRLIEVVATRGAGRRLSLCIAFRGADIKLNLASAEALMQAPDATIAGEASALLDLLLQPAASRALSNPALTVSGDANVVQALYHVVTGLDLRWDDYLAPFIGDIAAHELARVSAEARHWREESMNSLAASVDDYLSEEARLVPSAGEALEQRDRIDSLRLRLDRFDARLREAEESG